MTQQIKKRFALHTKYATALLALLYIGVFAPSLSQAKSDYLVGPDDVLQIDVLGEEDFSGKFRVNAAGEIFYPYIKNIGVRNLTVEGIGTLLTKRLKPEYLLDPHVKVRIVEFASKRVVVLGAVKTPGSISLTGATTILDVMSRAGGRTEDAGQTILLIKGGASANAAEQKKQIEPLLINYSRIVDEGDLSKNVVVDDGDVVNVQRGNEVYVLGNVKSPGPVRFTDKLTMLQAITNAGGLMATASPKASYIIRQQDGGKTEKLPIRLDKILANKAKNISLQANDIIYVPESFF